MIKNVYLKSIFRQPVRSLLLFLLIGVASFAFMLRTVEYIVIHRHIHEIGRNYRAIGFLRADEDLSDISQAADFLANSPFMGYEDRRRRFEAFLHDVYTTDVAGMPRHLPPEERRLYTAAFFYAEVHDIWHDEAEDGLIQVLTIVTDVVAGSPNHAISGQWMFVNYEFTPGDDTSAVDNLEIGETYFFKGHLYRTSRSPWENDWRDMMVMQPMPAPEEMEAYIERINRDSRRATLQTTNDMTILPDMQGRRSPMGLQAGRLINLSDYQERNHVAVINQNFSWMRGLGVGDTLKVTVYYNQFIHSPVLSSWEAEGGIIDSRPELTVASSPDERGSFELELEIVGVYSNFFRIDGTYGYGMIYVPDSILPPDLELDMGEDFPDDYLLDAWYGFVLNNTRREQAFFLEYRSALIDYGVSLHMIPSRAEVFWAAADAILLMTAFNAFVFGLVVVLVLSLVTFLYVKQRQRELAITRALGVSVKKILLQICISIFLIGLPGAIVGGTVAWHLAMQEAVAVLEPFAEDETRELALNPFRRDFVGAAIQEAAQPELSYVWLAVLIAAFFAFILAMILIYVFVYLRRPVLEQLQGRVGGNIGLKATQASDGEVPEYAAVPTTVALSKFDAKPAPGASFKHAMGWIFAHIKRSPAKTFLVVAITLLFVIALGWLQESIQRSEDNIDYLYDYTIVHVEVETNDIPFTAYERLQMLADSGYFDSISAESYQEMSFVIAKDAEGNVPDNWQEQIGFNPDIRAVYNIWGGVFDFLLGVSSIEEFIYEHSLILMDDEALGLVVEFIDGFDMATFEYEDRDLTQTVPIIISQSTAYVRGISLGDRVYLGYNVLPTAMSPWSFVEAEVVGIHNQHIHMWRFMDAAIVPVSVIEFMVGRMTMYHALRLTVDTAFNRELDSAREALYDYVLRDRTGRPFLMPLEAIFYDEELRNMVGAMSQILLLLELLYPVGLALAVVIGTTVFLLLMLQMEKNAAIMRVLGASPFKTCVMLCMEQILVCLGGLVLGLTTLMIMSWGFGFMALLTVAGIYLGGAVAGSLVGAIFITVKTPLDLLQVRE